MNVGMIKKIMMGLILITLIIHITGALIPSAQEAGDAINETGGGNVGEATENSSGIPLGTIVATPGVIWYVVVGMLILALVTGSIGLKGK